MPVIQAETLTDFSGGLNLHPDGFKLGLNESPDLMNIDVLPRGGFERRRGFAQFGGASPINQARSLAAYVTTAGTQQVIQHNAANDTFYWGNGGAWTSLGVTRTGVGRSTTFKDRLYVVDGNGDPFRWDGSTAFTFAAAGFAFNNNLETPTAPTSNGKFPKAKLIASWMGCVFVAGVTEGSTLFPNRVRWSHPNFPEDWHSKHYVDVTPDAGDAITALVPDGDRLLVFKRRSVHALYGAPPEGIAVTTLLPDNGAAHQDAVALGDLGVYFFDPVEGVFLIRGSKLEWQWEALYPAMLDGRISSTTADQVHLGWLGRRLWVSLPFDGAPQRSDMFILDPQLGGRASPGAWVRYRFAHGSGPPQPMGSFLEWAPPGAQRRILMSSSLNVVEYGFNAPDDNFGTPQRIPAWFHTAWVDLGVPALQKRWKKPELVLKAGVEADVPVEAFTDYDGGRVRRRFTVSTTGLGGYLQWGSGAPENKWGSNRWAPAGGKVNEIERGSPLGTARSVALRFGSPEAGSLADWGVNQVAFKFVPKRMR